MIDFEYDKTMSLDKQVTFPPAFILKMRYFFDKVERYFIGHI